MQRLATRWRALLRAWWRGSGVVSFVLSGLVVVLVLGLLGVLYISSTGRKEAIRDAKQLTLIAGQGIVQPALENGVVTDDPAALARLDAVVRSNVLREPIVRVKIWGADGEIVYSDDHRLMHKIYDLGSDEREILEEGGIAAEVSDLSRPENQFEPRGRKLLEVYVPVHTPGGTKLLFETYQQYRSIAASGRRQWEAFAPAVLGGLGVLWLLQVPLALRLARRVRQSQRDREELLLRAIQASDIERRRIARDLHDGAVQSLAGVTFSLAAAAEREAGTPLGDTLKEGAAATRQAIRELRSLLVEIYPPDLHRSGLAAALSDVVAPFASRGLAATVTVPDSAGALPVAVEGMVFRIAQEALRNTLKHARATQVEVQVQVVERRAVVSIADDGVGFDPAAVGEQSFGLRLLADLVRDAGGTISVDAAPGAGTRIRAEVPLP